MRNLKRLATSLVALVFVIAFSSCEKQPAADVQQDVVFSINNVTNTLKKGIITPDNPNDELVIPTCSDLEPAYVMMGMDGDDPIKLDILGGLNDGTETVVMKLDAPSTHVINSFMVYAADGTLIWAAPMNNSDYAQLWGLDGLEKKFEVEAFKKSAVTVDVLCWQEYSYKEFGFNWFDFQEVTIKTLCFFGDVCTKFYDDFYTEGSPYYQGPNHDGGYDMPAIFKVLIKTADGTIINDENINSNAEWFGEGSPLCIEYPDFGDTDNEMYTFEILLAYPDGSYNLIYTSDPFAAEADQSSITGDDGVFDFVVGNCSYDGNSTNIELPPYLYLPENGHIRVHPVNNNGIHYEYFDVKLLGSSWNNSLYPDELFENADLGAYCGDLYSLISGANAEYDVDIYSTLKPSTIPALYAGYPFGALNWLANQQQAITTNQIEGKYLQAMVWFIIHRDQATDSNGNSHSPQQLFNKVKNSLGLTQAETQAAKDVADWALDNEMNFVPETGEYSLVLFDPIENGNTVGTPNIQLVVVRVDP